jgi:hypothetical protein
MKEGDMDIGTCLCGKGLVKNGDLDICPDCSELAPYLNLERVALDEVFGKKRLMLFARIHEAVVIVQIRPHRDAEWHKPVLMPFEGHDSHRRAVKYYEDQCWQFLLTDVKKPTQVA